MATDWIPDVQETPPTSDQLSSILEYLGPSRSNTVVKESTGSTDALKKFKQNEQAFQRPLVVDWNNGRAGEDTACECSRRRSMLCHHMQVLLLTLPVVGDNESEILKLIRTLPKETEKV